MIDFTPLAIAAIAAIAAWFTSWPYETWDEIFYISMEGKHNTHAKGCVGKKELEDINARNI